MSGVSPEFEADRFIETTIFAAAHRFEPAPPVVRHFPGETLNSMLRENDYQNWQLSGLFTIPQTGLPLAMFLYVSSRIDTAESVQLQVNRVTGTAKIPVFQAAVSIPAQGAVQVRFDVAALGLTGQTVEVLMRSADRLNIFQLFPSVNIVQTFPADGSTLPLLFAPPANFQQIFPVGAVDSTTRQHEQDNDLQPISSTTGVLEVPQGVFAVRPLVQLVLSSFFNETLTAGVTVNRLVRSSTVKEHILSENVTVEPMGAGQLEIDSVEGLPVEINLTLSRTAAGGTLQPAVNVVNVFLAVEQFSSVLFVPAGQFIGVFNQSTGVPYPAAAGGGLNKEGRVSDE